MTTRHSPRVRMRRARTVLAEPRIASAATTQDFDFFVCRKQKKKQKKMHLTNNVTTMHLVPLERRRPRTIEMVNVRGVPHRPSQRHISYVIRLQVAASPPLDRFDAFLDDFVHNVNNSDAVYGKARRCETNDREVFCPTQVSTFCPILCPLCVFPSGGREYGGEGRGLVVGAADHPAGCE